MGGFIIKEKYGDLFTASSSLAHCVAADLNMGKGIAVTFKKLFGRVDELRKQNVTTGGCAVIKDQFRFIYYLVTTDRPRNKPTYDALEKSLKSMRKHMEENDVKEISIPRIGCGLDRMEWSEVSKRINNVFKDTDIQITVYVFSPSN